MNKDELKASKAYQALNQEEPIGSPPELDAAILAQAHKAVDAKPKAITPSPRSRLTLRWGAPIVSAALVVLPVTVFILMPELEQQQAIQRYENSLEADSFSELEAPPIQVKEQLVVQERKAAQRTAPKAMKKLAPPAPMASGISAQYFSEAEGVAMDIALSDQLESDSSMPQEAGAWVDDILKLIAEQQWSAAEQSYQLFVQAYPEHDFVKDYAKAFDEQKSAE